MLVFAAFRDAARGVPGEIMNVVRATGRPALQPARTLLGNHRTGPHPAKQGSEGTAVQARVPRSRGAPGCRTGSCGVRRAPRPSPRVQRRFQRGAAGPPVATNGRGRDRGGAERSPRGAAQPPDPPARIRSPCRDLQLLFAAARGASRRGTRGGGSESGPGPPRIAETPVPPPHARPRSAAAAGRKEAPR